MTKKTDLSKEIISATLILAANRPWQKISMNNIAEAAKIEPDILARIFGSKQSILNTFNHQIDEEIKTRFLNDQDKDSIRDQIFEIVMARFDALHPHKIAIKLILKTTILFDPLASAQGFKALFCSMQSAFELVGLSPAGYLRTAALSAIYLNSFKTWLQDDTPDMSETMAVLDDCLAKAETIVCPNLIPFSRRFN
jgi:ubiquinone biosynthesis protein COQ9